LTCYCFINELAKWRLRNNGNFPEEIYLQVDGGCENANATVLALLVSSMTYVMLCILHK